MTFPLRSIDYYGNDFEWSENEIHTQSLGIFAVLAGLFLLLVYVDDVLQQIVDSGEFRPSLRWIVTGNFGEPRANFCSKLLQLWNQLNREVDKIRSSNVGQSKLEERNETTNSGKRNAFTKRKK